MRRLLSLIALCLALVLGAAPSFAADADHGAQIFSANCAACHMGGGNVVNAERTLKKEALESYLTNYSAGHEEAIQYQVTNGKNAMPSHAADLTEDQRWAVVHYVRALQRAQAGGGHRTLEHMGEGNAEQPAGVFLAAGAASVAVVIGVLDAVRRHKSVFNFDIVAAGSGQAIGIPIVMNLEVFFWHQEETALRRAAVLLGHGPHQHPG